MIGRLTKTFPSQLSLGRKDPLRSGDIVLFAYSPQCNFSGAKTPLQWIKKVQRGALNDVLKKDPINKAHERSNMTENFRKLQV